MILLITLTAIGALLAGACYWYTFWKAHAVKFEKSGYTPPRTSIFGRTWFYMACRVLAFATVGSVKVVGRKNQPPPGGHVIFAANHQLPCDFAMIRLGSGRHFRMLTIANELKGFLGVLSAFFGVISVVTGKNGEGAMAEAACVDAIAEDDGALGIFPQGALLPDNVLRKTEFRPGLVRMAKTAHARLNTLSTLLGKQKAGVGPAVANSLTIPVLIVPIGILYRHDPVYADWTHRFLTSTRSMFLGMRKPMHWDPLFKIDVETLPADEKARIEALREQKLKAYRKSHVTNYGGVVVIGEPIEASTLPEDPLEAIEFVRQAIAALVKDAEQR